MTVDRVDAQRPASVEMSTAVTSARLDDVKLVVELKIRRSYASSD